MKHSVMTKASDSVVTSGQWCSVVGRQLLSVGDTWCCRTLVHCWLRTCYTCHEL